MKTLKDGLKIGASIKKKQQGATLLTVMVFLVVITVVTVSATKISILDVLISGNDQQKSIAFQTTENSLKLFAQTDSLSTAIGAGFNTVSDQYKTLDSSYEENKIVTDMPEVYPCERAGMASSMGPAAPPCDMYDFKVKQQRQNTGIREEHHRGGGKMIPNAGSKGSLL